MTVNESASLVDSPAHHGGGHETARQVAHLGIWLSLIPAVAAGLGYQIGSGWAAFALATGPFIFFSLLEYAIVNYVGGEDANR